MPFGFTLPLARSTGSLGYFAFTSTELDAIKQNLKSLIVTNHGERPMRYDFGCNLREFMFEQERGDELKQRIADRILEQVARWMPYISVSELTIMFSEEDPHATQENSVRIDVKFSIVSRPSQTGLLSVTVP